MKTPQIKLRMLGGMAAGVVLMAGMSTTAFAQSKMMGSHDKMMGSDNMMSMMDTNHDGMVSADEHSAYGKTMFDKMDANHDGMVSKAEMDAGMKMMHDTHMKNGMMKDDSMKDDSMSPPKP